MQLLKLFGFTLPVIAYLGVLAGPARSDVITTFAEVGLPSGTDFDDDSGNTTASSFVSSTFIDPDNNNYATGTAYASVSSPMHLGVRASTGVRSLAGGVKADAKAGAIWSDSIVFDSAINRSILLEVSATGTLRAQPASDFSLGSLSDFRVSLGGDAANIRLLSTNDFGLEVSANGWDSYSVFQPDATDPYLQEFTGTFLGMIAVSDGFADWSLLAEAVTESLSGNAGGLLASASSDFGNSAEIVGLRFADTGLTPEQEGIAFTFSSGAPSPNAAAVPEPSSFFMLLIGVSACGLIRRSYRSKKAWIGLPLSSR